MSFLTAETGHLGSPVETFEFDLGGLRRWYFTGADDDVDTGTIVFKAIAIKRSEIEYTNDPGKSSLEITTQRDLAIADLFKAGTPSAVLSLTVRRFHRGDGVSGVIWVGRVIDCKWSSTECTLICEPIRSSMQNPGLRRFFQRQCAHVLYGEDCRVNNLAYRVAGTASSVTSTTVSITGATGYAADRFAGGYLEWTNPSTGTQERRAIRSSTSGQLVVTTLEAITGLIADLPVEVYPGCNHTLDHCHGRFGNAANFGGMPHTPTKNPFDGTPIY